jgi:hypothetical protein
MLHRLRLVVSELNAKAESISTGSIVEDHFGEN